MLGDGGCRSATDYAEVDAATYPVQVKGAVSDEALLEASLPVKAGTIYSVAAVGGAGKDVRLLPVVDGTAPGTVVPGPPLPGPGRDPGHRGVQPAGSPGGAMPGQDGPAVISGQVDSKSGPAVFYRLRGLADHGSVGVLPHRHRCRRLLAQTLSATDRSRRP